MLRVKCYDNQGKTFDRYTVLFLKAEYSNRCKYYTYLSMSDTPFHPQGFCQHGEISKLLHFCEDNKQIPFSKLPIDCQKAVNQERG